LSLLLLLLLGLLLLSVVPRSGWTLLRVLLRVLLVKDVLVLWSVLLLWAFWGVVGVVAVMCCSCWCCERAWRARKGPLVLCLGWRGANGLNVFPWDRTRSPLLW